MSTLESWDDNTTPLVDLTANEELVLPLVNQYTSWAYSGVEPASAPPGAYTRGLPWLKRTALRVRGWIHFYSPNYFTGNDEGMMQLQIQRFWTDETTGNIIQPNNAATTYAASDDTVYWRFTRYNSHSSSWTSPDNWSVFKGSVFVDRKMRVPMQEMETLGLRITNRVWNGASMRLFCRVRLRTLVQSG